MAPFAWSDSFTCTPWASGLGLVAQIRREPALRLGPRQARARCVVGDLVAIEAADGEIARIRVREVEARHARRGPHRIVLGERDPDSGRVEQREERTLARVIGAR